MGGETDWRLPNITELDSINNDKRSNPTTDTVFTTAFAAYYWSSTTDRTATLDAWRVSFIYGHVLRGQKTATAYLRCVRGG